MFSHQLNLKSMSSSLASFYLAASLHPRNIWLWKKSQIWSGFPGSETFQELYWRVRCSAHNEQRSLQARQVKPRRVPPLWAVPRLQTIIIAVNYASIINKGSGFLTPAGVQHRVGGCSEQDSSALGTEILVLKWKSCSCRHGFILCHMFTDREAFPVSLTPRAPVETRTDISRLEWGNLNDRIVVL